MLVDKETFVPGKISETKLKPSQALRIGAALRPKCTGRYFRGGGSCAEAVLLAHYTKIVRN